MTAEAADTVWAPRVVLPALLGAYLPGQRWFAGKGRRIEAVAVADYAWLPDGGDGDVLALVDVSCAGRPPERYCLCLGLRDDPGALPEVGRLSLNGTARTIAEVAADPRGVAGLLTPLADARHLPTDAGGRLRMADVGPAVPKRPPGASTIRAVGGEQSNTSVRIGHDVVLKLIRYVQAGENPEVEIGRFLTSRVAFPAIPRLQGSITYEAPDGWAATVGVLQSWVENEGDGWSHVVSRLTRLLSHHDHWATMQEELTGLGATTAALHDALASDPSSPAFRPVPVEAADVARWTTGLQADVAGVRARVATLLSLPRDGHRLLAALDAAPARIAAMVPAIGDPATRFAAIRIHGDYHLGQTLKTPARFVIVDFEGEPARPLEERRRKQCALKDVAGMLRSFDYALAVAGDGTAPDAARREGLAMRAAFLQGYFARVDLSHAVFVPADGQARARWLAFFELEKAVYELEYELNHRPTWVHIPLDALVRILET